jgi:hypothetical protein
MASVKASKKYARGRGLLALFPRASHHRRSSDAGGAGHYSEIYFHLFVDRMQHPADDRRSILLTIAFRGVHAAGIYGDEGQSNEEITDSYRLYR